MPGSEADRGTAPLALTMGDPAGVGPQLALRAWLQRKPGQRPFYVIASRDQLLTTAFLMARDPGVTHQTAPLALQSIGDPREAAEAFETALPVFNIACPSVKPGEPDPASAGGIVESIRLAVEHTRAGAAAAVVTNPINKALLYRAGFQHPGHTEYLAELDPGPAGARRPVMMLVGGGLHVALATIHLPLAAAARSLTQDLILETARTVHGEMRAKFGITAPRIGLCGLNPHAGEGGALGREEIDIINPAAARLRAEGVDISDARPGDTIFHEQRHGHWDVVIAMYHDQGLIPVKTLDIWGGVNVTLGLSFIRTSPDHGTAYDAAAGTANPDSLMAALALADRMASARDAAR
jgi:4-hydroxythreonine-4-phosphate dehydrogenase